VADPVITIEGLRKSYGDFEAVRGLDLEVERGEIFAFLGPNGAGKTTTVEILEGYRKRSAGEVSVLGEDPNRAPRSWRERIGIVLQQCRMPPELTVRETLEQYGGYFKHSRPVDETIGLVGLGHKADARAGKLSGGQQRRLDVAVALIGDPELLFLDEPTTGFDPTARRQAWKVISNLRELGKTIFLTTHYMEEAQYLADRAAIIVRGELIAEGSPHELGRQTGADTEIRFRLPPEVRAEELPTAFAIAEASDGFVTLRTGDPVKALNELTGWALGHGADLSSLEVGRPSLEDIYLELTGEHGEGADS
jgi:ABC-2 type transport system ATP-binding protein